ncbi:PREDICTED: uncharacterized protein DDB_G0287625 [Cyphomyrmex costatus]|uniref:DUF3752 domain-containing protein n=1 Tax=Cyphomyrmex costatus TaxID=456900 RepID=A0A151I797_9HYME|nr:PREDICTED: uncharacterized protein DDB_G0287625 [Cyphomyrmex costatus]KYM93978.1 hypothetical protein ALC62_15423 [Cyphomyrmex costatus]
MTAMNSDSESQDSDDGRRFRFEATRKDSVATVDTTDRTKTPNKHKSSHSESYRDRKDRFKHESGSKIDDKDFRHFTKHSKHELRNLKQEDSKISHKDYRENKSGFVTNDRSSRNSNGGDARERSRDSKRQSDRDRSIHRMQRSREHSYERNYHDERALSDKHRGRYYERHKHRSRDKSRDRSHQSNRVKSSNDDYRSREDHGRYDSSKKISKENKSQNSRDYSSPKNTERERSHSETRSSENTRKDSSIEAQDCKDLDLSQFDVLSETDENMSDSRDSESRTSSPHSHKLKKHDSEIQSESYAKRKNNDETGTRKRQEELKVKRRSYDPASSSSNNNPSAVSDSLLNSASTLLVTREARMDSEREKSEYCEEERMLICDSNVERSNLKERYSCSNASSEIQLFEKNMDQAGSTYGPLLPPGLASNAPDSNELNSEMNILNENKINDEVDGKNTNFIGPRLLPQLNDCQSIEREDTTDAVFGPALPPHLLQRQQEKDSPDRIIGPVLPDVLKSREEDLVASPKSDDDSAIGPLPVDHPALRTSRVHEQLDLRAQRIRNEKYSEEMDIGNKREEWMTELPPAQAANLGLGPRKFRFRDGPDMSDRSCWTDTPAQKAQKQMDLEAKNFRESEKKHVNEYHKKEVDKSRKHEKSLLEMHQSKIAKKKKKEEKEARRTGISTRRPFDRDIDLQVNRFDQAQKKSILLKAQLLDDRFSRGQI